jgi:hypothetical protein
MKSARCVGLAALGLLLTGFSFALEQGPRGPTSRRPRRWPPPRDGDFGEDILREHLAAVPH